jgi:MFS family permease
MALVGTTPIGSPVIGALADSAGPRYSLALGAVACLGAVVIGLWPAGRERQPAESPSVQRGHSR